MDNPNQEPEWSPRRTEHAQSVFSTEGKSFDDHRNYKERQITNYHRLTEKNAAKLGTAKCIKCVQEIVLGHVLLSTLTQVHAHLYNFLSATKKSKEVEVSSNRCRHPKPSFCFQHILYNHHMGEGVAA